MDVQLRLGNPKNKMNYSYFGLTSPSDTTLLSDLMMVKGVLSDLPKLDGDDAEKTQELLKKFSLGVADAGTTPNAEDLASHVEIYGYRAGDTFEQCVLKLPVIPVRSITLLQFN